MSAVRDCLDCGVLKPLTDFPMANNGRNAKSFSAIHYFKDARSFVCRECKKKLVVKSIAENRRLKRLDKGGWQCLKCGEITHPSRKKCNRCKEHRSDIKY